MIEAKIPVLGFAAYSGTGKTTLLKQLIPLLKTKGVKVGVIKHSHHQFEIDQPGKDSFELRKAGAEEMLVACHSRWALMVDTDHSDDPVLQELVDRLDQNKLDLILVEGFKHESFPKIELHRPSRGKPLMFPEDPDIMAFACDASPTELPDLPLLDINQPQMIAEFVVSYCGIKR
ncbi:MAG: molybdopterin-guanine dinucleotide biosynthesis protein B [Gammaproteobacteria bacterium]|nr:molybdopterin-guanine dinucleotide biosynthesis protein B [Gammaproteobacteria bacterium]